MRVFLERADRLHRRDLPRGRRCRHRHRRRRHARAVAERLFDPGQLSGGESLTPPLLIVPLGTANLMGKHLGIAWDDRRLDEQVLHVLRTGTGSFGSTPRVANGGLFLLMAGVGLDAHVVHDCSTAARARSIYLSYVLPDAARRSGRTIIRRST